VEKSNRETEIDYFEWPTINFSGLAMRASQGLLNSKYNFMFLEFLSVRILDIVN
jgi:hypothetical protein